MARKVCVRCKDSTRVSHGGTIDLSGKTSFSGFLCHSCYDEVLAAALGEA